MAKNIINEDLIEGLAFAGGYLGTACDGKQKSFQDLLHAIVANVFNDEDIKSMPEAEVQKKIDLTIQTLENIAKSCIDEENMVIHYDEAKLAKMIKEKYPDCSIIFGGHQVNRESDILKTDYIDYCLFGEGEETAVML